jgi:hypothetical protein
VDALADVVQAVENKKNMALLWFLAGVDFVSCWCVFVISAHRLGAGCRRRLAARQFFRLALAFCRNFPAPPDRLPRKGASPPLRAL